MKDNFLKRCIGLSLVLFSTATLLFSAAFLFGNMNPVQANNSDTLYGTGKYQMSLSSVYDAAADDYAYFILVWDTETGKSKFYGNTKGSFEYYTKLPTNPLD